MFSPFIVLLRLSKSLARNRTKCLFLNDEPCMVRSTLIDMNPNELKYYPLIISLNKCTGSRNVLSPKVCLPKEVKDINVKIFNIIKSKGEAKAMTEYISCNWKCKLIVQNVIQKKNGIIKHVNVNVKIIMSVKKVIAGITAHVFVIIVSI